MEVPFSRRHIGPDSKQTETMLRQIGTASLDQLVSEAVPETIRYKGKDRMADAFSESDLLARAWELAQQNQVFKSYIGMGYADCHTPSVILRGVLENPGWYTQYTPYQSEISQGRLEALLNFQTMVSDLTGLPISNASLLDEATAAAEAMAFCLSINPKEGSRFFVSKDCHPQTIEVIKTRAEGFGVGVDVGEPPPDGPQAEYFAAMLQCPSTDGRIIDYRAWAQKAKTRNVRVIVATDLLALTLMEAPGAWGADVVVGNSQRFGVPLGYGGPHAAFFATRDEYKRRVPGRLVGISKDASGRDAFRLALQTREQHIRREKATSNICTAQVLLAVIASMYAVYHGPEGLKEIARRVHRMTCVLKKKLEELGHRVVHSDFFDTLRVAAPNQAILQKALAERVNFRIFDNGDVGISLDEATTPKDFAALLGIFGGKSADLAAGEPSRIPAALVRKTPYLQAPAFHQYRSETEMLRYIKTLEQKDLSLTTSMIPLGSCTMKLNAASEMLPITWPEFGKIHPFAPVEQTKGYQTLMGELSHDLAEITGFDAVSLQPNAGSQGEYAGLLVIRAYLRDQGQGTRDVCLIPQSAHGTNPATAVMAGMQVIVVACDRSGNIDLEDLKKKCRENKDRLAALMVTYPSTHGVFEESIREICEAVHASGGQVYMDGANLNAQIGLCHPGEYGPDVCHLNLHKTFSIPHGGGGPGMGPIAVKKHLAPYLPKHPVIETGGERGIGAVSAAPWGSPSILIISWAYIKMMGASGLRKASEIAILNANYIASRLNEHFPVLYRGRKGRVAHECIVDLRALKETSGVEVEDVAKRLMDYGFHAPTVSFPVAGTLMIEPTESESLGELDRFCEAMIHIREEIRKVESGKWDKKDNPLKNAPHTAEEIVSDDWAHPYSREIAAFPAEWLRKHKYWPPVARVDNVYGDRNLVCTCPPIEDMVSSPS